MDLMNSTLSTTPPTLRQLPFCTPLSSFSTNNSSRITFSKSRKFRLLSQFSSNFPLSNRSRFRISAHFDRRSSRRNYLRRKIADKQQQEVSGNSVISAPISESVQEYDKFDQNWKALHFDSGIARDSTKSRDIKLSRPLGESVLWDKLENWVEQYKKDTEFWGIGTGTIFTVYQDSGGKVERVVVNEDEILRRSKVQPALFRDATVEDLSEVNEKISFAKSLAREMEFGNNVIPANSLVTKFLISGEGKLDNVLKGISGFSLNLSSYKMLPQIGIVVLCGFIATWGMKMLFRAGNNEQNYTRLEKEMLRRKWEARMKKEKDVKGTVEVVKESTEHNTISSIERPQFNKEKLMSSIMKARESHNKTAMPEYSSSQNIGDTEFDFKIREIREMARRARELEEKNSLPNKDDEEADSDTFGAFSNENNAVEQPDSGSLGSQLDLNEYGGDTRDLRKTSEPTPLDSIENDARIVSCVTAKSPTDTISSTGNESDLMHDASLLNNVSGIIEQSAIPGGLSSKPQENYVKTKSRIIMSVKEAREYLSRKHDKFKENQESIAASVDKVDTLSTNLMENKAVGCVNRKSDDSSKLLEDPNCERKKSVIQESIAASVEQVVFTNLMEKKNIGCVNKKSDDSCELLEDSNCERKKSLPMDNSSVAAQDSAAIASCDLDLSLHDGGHTVSFGNRLPDLVLPIEGATSNESISDQDDKNKLVSPTILVEASTICQDSSFTNEPSVPAMEIPEDVKKGVADWDTPGTPSDKSQETTPLINKENWLEKNFHVLEPVINKMQMGFRDNYFAAKDKSNQELDAKTKPLHLETSKYGGELEWMKDERLKEIVFKVRENELAGRDPFFLMSSKDKLAFFDGLEKKVEQENKQLLNLHEWLHANIENLDYGTDGISLYDPPQKIMPRWRGPPMEKIHELLNSFVELRKTVDGSTKDSTLMNKYGQETHLKSTDSPSSDKICSTLSIFSQKTELEKKSAKAPKTIIEGSDGSARAGKKYGKEYWQHTKKWSQGFLESYNAETNPEIKGVIKDIGKDLDRWITEKEIQEAGELLDNLPERGKKFIREKLDKVRREMELYGPQAVVSKYREYADEKVEDYLWWLDLPYILCIEMYIKQEGEMKVGFYSLEMAADLELDPRPNHVIAFEDAGDCKNLCYIIQAHMDMLGNGNAFVVAQQPKNAFQEAKANGFGVTVIGKGELQLNVDQPLEEVEEVISEIGSKIYHDKIMCERGVDIKAVMQGVFGTGKPPYSKISKRKLRKLLENRRK